MEKREKIISKMIVRGDPRMEKLLCNRPRVAPYSVREEIQRAPSRNSPRRLSLENV